VFDLYLFFVSSRDKQKTDFRRMIMKNENAQAGGKVTK
jgi:hypothetical protein